MTPPKMTRMITARKWTGIAVSGVAAGLVASAPAHADWAKPQPERLWLAASEGGEGGESGAIQGASPDVAYLTRLQLVEGHMRAAVLLYKKGMRDDAVGLAGHPEAEMMDEVRASLAEYSAADFTPALEAVGTIMSDEAPQDKVDETLAILIQDIHNAMEIRTFAPKTRVKALIALTRAAAVEYDGSIVDGALDDPMPYYEAYGFIQTARSEITDLKTLGDPELSALLARIETVLDKSGEAFGDIRAVDAKLADPAILYGVAAEVELIGFGVN